MKYKKLHILCVSLIIPSLVFSGCHKKYSSNEKVKIQESFNQYLDDMFCASVSSDTLTLNYMLSNPSAYGVESFSPTLGEFSIAQMKEDYQEEQKNFEQLKKIPYGCLTDEQKICYQLLEDSYNLDLSNSKYMLYHEVLGPTTGLQAQLPIVLAEYRFSSEEDVKNYLSLLQDMPRYFTQICDFEKAKSKAGIFMSDAVANKIITQCKTFIKDPESNYLIHYFNAKIDSLDFISGASKKEYISKNKEFVLNYVIPAYEKLIATLNELLGTGTNNEGLSHFKNGAGYYEYLVKSKTGTSYSMKELTKKIDSTLQNSISNMLTSSALDSELSKKLNHYKFVETTPSGSLNYLKNHIQTDFPDLAEVNCCIKDVDTSLQEFVSPAMYMIPPLDCYNDNCIYVNKNPKYDMSEIFPTIAHEGYPGHLYQNVYFRSQNVHPVRYTLTNLGYEEGWATYAEIYSYQIAGLDDGLAQLLAQNTIASLCIYSRADIGIHYEGWSKQDTIDYIKKYFTSDAGSTIYDTLLEEPAVYLPYCVGYIQINDLKEKAQAQLKDDFSLKEFHEFLLDIGPANFEIINDQFNTWIDKQ